MKVIYNRNVWIRILQFYFRAIKNHPNTYTRKDAIADAQKAYRDRDFLPSHITLKRWKNQGYSVERNRCNWYFAYLVKEKLKNVYEAEHQDNMKDVIELDDNNASISQQLVFNPMRQVYYDGMRIGYCPQTRKYNILNKASQPLSKVPLTNVRFFKQPFGKYSIIAHVNVNGELWAMDINGKFYDMNRSWKDAYLGKNEIFRRIGQIITETINNFLRRECI